MKYLCWGQSMYAYTVLAADTMPRYSAQQIWYTVGITDIGTVYNKCSVYKSKTKMITINSNENKLIFH